nr:hypothetical protein CFP56_21036 [Quercus suber]
MSPNAPLDLEASSQRQTASPKGIKRRWLSPAPVESASSPRTGSVHEAAPGSSSSPPRKVAKITPSSAGMEALSPERSGAVKLTRTGRVSRAAKGRRVHGCDECGKVSVALSAHSSDTPSLAGANMMRSARRILNHKPGAFLCDVSGCDRSFNREDLLIRHKARQRGRTTIIAQSTAEYLYACVSNRAQQVCPPVSVIHSCDCLFVRAQKSVLLVWVIDNILLYPSILFADVGDGSGIKLRTCLSTPWNPMANSRYCSSAPPRKSYLPFSELGMGMPIPVDESNAAGYFGFWPASPSYSSSHESPTQEFAFGDGLPHHGQTYAVRPRNAPSTAFNGVWAPSRGCHSPASIGSSTHISHSSPWNVSHFSATAFQPNTSPGSDLSCESIFGVSTGILGQQCFDLAFLDKSTLISINERDVMEETLLGLSMTRVSAPLGLGSDGLTLENEEKYLASYWHWVHPQFPVVDKSSFMGQAASPLLTAAMLALGAHLHHTHDACKYGRVIHERCRKILKRLACEAQLLEQDITVGDPTSAFTYDIEYKRLMLLACYILDQQHSSLFGRKTADCLLTLGMNLPFPRPQSDIGAPFRSSLQSDCPKLLYQTISEKFGIAATSEERFNTFQSSLILSCLADTNTNADLCGFDLGDDLEVSPLFLAIEQSARTKIAYHASMLCRNSPVRQLLAVAGESWIIAEKLDSEAEFTVAQREAKRWAEGKVPALASAHLAGSQAAIERALYHAMEILRLHMAHPKTGLLYQEWSLYLASIVIWARAYVVSITKRSSHRLSIPTPAEARYPQRNERELEQNVAALLRAGPTNCFGGKEATDVLLWTKNKIEQVNVPHNCGVTNSALDVLRKLLLRGKEPGWFGI